MSTTYSPSFEHPLTENLTVVNELIVETSASIAELHTDQLFVDVASISTLEVVDITASGDISAATLSAPTVSGSTGAFTSGVSAPQGDFTVIYADSINASDLSLSSTISAATGSFSAGVSAPQGDFSIITAGTGNFSAGLSAPEILTNIQYVNDGQRDIQDGIDSASSGQAIYLSPGSFGGATVVVSASSIYKASISSALNGVS